MTITQALIDKQASQRFLLAKIQPKRLLNPSLESAGGLWQVTLPFRYLKNVKRNGIALTRDTSTPTLNDHFSYENGVLKIKLAAAPSASNIITAEYALYFSSGETVVTYDPPTGTAGDLVEYEPRIRNLPEFNINISDIQNGVFSISGTTLAVDNIDRDINNYLTVNDWFKYADINLYACYESEQNCEKFYVGTITDVDLDDVAVNFAIGDAFTKLGKPAYMGSRNEAIATYSEFNTLYPKHVGENIPMILATCTPGATKLDGYGYSADFVDPQIMNKAICTDYFAGGGTSDNRYWQACRLLPTSGQRIKAATFGTPNFFSCQPSIGTPYKFVIKWANALAFSAQNLEPCDSVAIEFGPYIGYGMVTYVDASNREIGGYSPNWNTFSTAWNSSTQDLAAISSFAGMKFCIALRDIKNGKYFFPIHGYEYTINTGIIDSGYSVDIAFLTSLETTMEARKIFSSWNDGYADYNNLPEYQQFSTIRLDPDNYEVLYKVAVSNDIDFTFGNVVKRMVELGGLQPATPFVDIPSASPGPTENIRTHMQIPDRDEMYFDTYLKYLQELLRPFACCLKLNSTGDEVKLFGLRPPVDGHLFDENNIIEGSLSIETDFNDIITEIISYNDYPIEEWQKPEPSEFSVTVSDDYAEFLNGEKASTTIIHSMQFINTRIFTLLNILKNRKALYRFQTATQGFNLTIGDSITLKHNNLLGGAESINLIITGISKNIETVSIEASDLGGI